MSSPDALVAAAAVIEPVQSDLHQLAEGESAPVLREALTLALERREVDSATNLALALLSKGETVSRDVVERLYPDVVDDRAGNVLIATHPERLAIFEALFTSRRLDRYQLALAAALFVHLGHDPSPTLIGLLRRLARNRAGWVGERWAAAAALRVNDPQVNAMFGLDAARPEAPAAIIAGLDDEPTFESLREERSPVVAAGFTARRSASKVGRNETCPCGSGKKYKKCCAKRDGGRSSFSPVAGLTMRDYRSRLHEFLDADALRAQHPADLATLPWPELSLEQLDAIFVVFVECERLSLAELVLERICAFEEVSDDERDNVRAFLVEFAHDWGHEDLVARHVPLFLDASKVPAHVHLGQAIRHPDREVLELLEAECRRYVVDGERPPHDVVYELLSSHPALGVLLTRGSLDVGYVEEGWQLLRELEWARDKLDAAPNDPYWVVWEGMLGEHRLARAGEAEKEALRAELERMRAQAEDARSEAHVLLRDLGNHEAELAELEARAIDAEALAEERASNIDLEEQARQARAARVLRSKIRELEARIREGQVERTELRRRVRETTSEPAELPSDGSPARQAPDSPDGMEAHGVRIPRWSDRAVSSIAKLPRHVASAAVAMAGALGAGRPEAWRQAKRLEGFEGFCSARLGIHHRLLFWTETDGELRVDDVVSREGLDRALAARR